MHCTHLLRSDDEKTLEERLALFSLETIDIESNINVKNKEVVDRLAINTVGRVVGKSVTGYSWLLKPLPSIYSHKNSETAGRMSHRCVLH